MKDHKKPIKTGLFSRRGASRMSVEQFIARLRDHHRKTEIKARNRLQELRP